MPDIQWDSEASLMRVTAFETADTQEELVARGTLRDLIGQVLGMGPQAQQDLLLRAAGPDWVEEYDTDAIRELAARAEYTGAHGESDTADRDEDPDRAEVADEDTLVTGGVSGPGHLGGGGRS